MTGPLLAVEQATVRFGAVAAVDHVDLAVPEGEVMAVLGPSGSGKSTLLRAVAGLQPLDEGRVVLAGRSLDGVPPHRRGLGLMFQDHALFPHRDVAANIAFGLRMAGWSADRIRARVAELLDLVDLAGYEHRRISTLSGGEQQRVALARSLAPSPRLLLLDEPLGALDRPLRERLVGDLRRIAIDLGLTVVAVTHDHDEAFALADRVALMDRGAVLQVGPPAAVWQQPTSRRVAEVLGLPNLLTATVRGGRAAGPWGSVPVAGPDGAVTLHLPRQALRVDDAGPIEGVAGAATFRGDSTELRVELAGGAALDLLVAPPAPSPGTVLRLAVDPAAIVRLDR